MDKIEYKYYLFRKCWLARLEKGRYSLEPKQFFIDGIWKYDHQLNLDLNDSMMNYNNYSIFDHDEISEKEAINFIASGNRFLSKEQILSAKECYLFKNNTIYISVDDKSDLFVYYLENKSWDKRNHTSFWFSWDLSPDLFKPIQNDCVVKMIFDQNFTPNQQLNTNNVIREKEENIKSPFDDSYCKMNADEIILSLEEKYKNDEEALEIICRGKNDIAYIRSQKNYDGQTPEQYALSLAYHLAYWH